MHHWHLVISSPNPLPDPLAIRSMRRQLRSESAELMVALDRLLVTSQSLAVAQGKKHHRTACVFSHWMRVIARAALIPHS